MKIPKKVKIGPLAYEVIFSKDIANEGDCWGSTHHRTQKIFLDPASKKDKLEETFLHELIHAIMQVNSLVYRFDEKEKYPSAEEVTRSMAVTLYQVVKDNPKIFI